MRRLSLARAVSRIRKHNPAPFAPFALCLLAVPIPPATLSAQDPSAAARTAPPNGPRQVDPGWHALVHARVVTEPGSVLEDATIVVRDGRIVRVEAGGEPPQGARVWDQSGHTVYPALIDAHVPVDAPVPDPGAPGSHWHPAVHPQRSALDGDGLTAELALELRGLGFGTAAIAPKGGIFRGTGAVVLLDEPRAGEHRRVLAEDTYQEVSFDRAGGGYPGSLMGAIALVRQTLIDGGAAAARVTDPTPFVTEAALFKDRATRAGIDLGTAPLLFDIGSELDALRVHRILREPGAPPRAGLLLGCGTEFRRLEPIAGTGLPLILPLAFPAAPPVESLADRDAVSLRDMLTWEQAPTNAARLRAAGVEIALTTDKLDEREHFHRNLRRAIEAGLSTDDALAMLTTAPARMLGLGHLVGEIAPGYLANLLVVDGELFDEERELREIWIQGRRHELEAAPVIRLAGAWETAMKIGDLSVESIRFDGEKKIELVAGEDKVKARKLDRGAQQVDFVFDAAKLGGKAPGGDGVVAVTAVVQGDRMLGVGVDAAGRRFAWSARRAQAAPESTAGEEPPAAGGEPAAGEEPPAASEPAAAKAAPPDPTVVLPIPLGAYGRTALPPQPDLLVQGATIWTSGPDGIVEDGVLAVRGGRIVYVGPRAGAPELPGALVVDATGLAVTPGLIDCHSHTGISGGVNEGGQAVTAEVRVGDVVDPDDIGWYRELAGGLTVADQLHGSANPIGGQNSVVKLRWGVRDPEQMKLAGAIGGIKFALGENVKRSRSESNERYPNTRMGVEALIRDRFAAARDYTAEWQRYRLLAAGDARGVTPPRRDLELEALAEVLAGERLVHCHSYRQDEILMLCRVAQEFGFRIGTFQHGLEGYKVAEAIAQCAIGASIFTDWWAYKFEVIDAIPENAAIMHEVGVTVSFNSDSNELARRLNTEAAKAVKYGGLSPHAALRMVTLNPAKQLGIEDRVGSLEVGKDADFVLWSGDPLSSFSRCLETYIDGRRYFSIDEDHAMREIAHRERQRLIQKLLALDDGDRQATARDGSGDASLDNKPGECGCELWEERR